MKTREEYCSNVRDTSEVVRLRKILSSTQFTVAFLQEPQDDWTTTSKESLESLLYIHFFGNTSVQTSADNTASSQTSAAAREIVTEIKIAWAILD